MVSLQWKWLFAVIPIYRVPRFRTTFEFSVDEPPKGNDGNAYPVSKAGYLPPSCRFFLEFFEDIFSYHATYYTEMKSLVKRRME
jgi:hypothetical protein